MTPNPGFKVTVYFQVEYAKTVRFRVKVTKEHKKETIHNLSNDTKKEKKKNLFAVNNDNNACSCNAQLKSAQRDTNLRAGTLQPDRTF